MADVARPAPRGSQAAPAGPPVGPPIGPPIGPIVASVVALVESLGSRPFFQAVQRSLALVLPLVMVGALALMLRNFPLAFVPRGLDAAFGGTWRVVCEHLVRGSFGIAALAVLSTFSYTLAVQSNLRHAGQSVSPAMTAAIVLSSFFVLAAPSGAGSWQDFASLDRGLLVAFLVAAAGGHLFLRLSRLKLFRLPLPAVGHDHVVHDALTALPAGMATILLFGLARALLELLGVGNLHETARQLLAVPFHGAGDSLGLGLAYVGLSQVFWFFGAHGPNLLFSVEQNILTPALLDNVSAFAQGQALPHILTKPFLDAFTRMGGSGCTLCLILAVFLRSRDSGSRRLCLIALLPALCNVNEPLLFGLPLVFNPVYVVPFLLVPVVQTVAAYAATLLDLVPRTMAEINWTAPPLLGGYAATGSLAGPVMQVVNLALGVLIYLPFVSLADRMFDREYRRALEALREAALRGAVGPGGRRCLDLPGVEGRIAKALANDLSKALDRGDQLYLVYQPQLCADGGCVLGAEALLRWRHPAYGLVPPQIAVALAEDAGLIDRLGLFVLREACDQRAAWRGRVPDDLTVAVNMSARQLHDAGLLEKIRATLDAAGLPPSMLEVELTESAALLPDARSLDTLRRLRKMGAHVAIDDFGMGHASLRYLQEFPVDTLKLDRSLTLETPSGVNGHIVSSMVGLCANLEIRTVVEGVETMEQCERFRALGCQAFQGYLFSLPLSGEDCLAFIVGRQARLKRPED